MNETTVDLDAFREELVVRGFTPDGWDGGYGRGPLAVTVERGWVVLSEELSAPPAGGEAGAPGTPGLWRGLTTDSGNEMRVFELSPAAVGAGGPRRDDWAPPGFGSLLDWALATAEGAVPHGWEPPSEADLAEWVPAAALTVRAGSLLRQGTAVRAPDRLALEVPILGDLSAGLSEARRSWLRLLVDDARRTWRTARFGTVGEGGVRAEIDLTGAPPESLERLCRAARDTLRFVAEWILPPADLLADVSLECRAPHVLSPAGALARPETGGA